MSELTDELDYIWGWLQSTSLEFVDCYNQGLTRQQVDEIVKVMPFKLSDEFYELYQWRNGIADLGFNNYYPLVEFLFPDQLFSNSPTSFCTLQDSISNYHDLWQLEQSIMINKPYDSYKGWDQKWFPIASFENKRILYIVGDLDPSPIYLVDYIFLDNPLRVYKSLISMISVIAECCELGLYQIIPDEYGEEEDMIIRIDEDKLELEKEIYRKYNS
ncbi:SMI1/KNR4 family protein [Nostoc sp.]|uniref:SMI1/KNR4 family protein n=1 Tax=Nostoc sp. TaxID=1180 RepID=UPI002FF13D21